MKKEDIFALIDSITPETSMEEFFGVYAKIVQNTMTREERNAVGLTSKVYGTMLLGLWNPEKMVEDYKKLLKEHVERKWLTKEEPK